MATAAENIATAISNLTIKIAEVSASMAPDYSIDGQTVSRSKYLADLNQQLENLLKLQNRVSGPIEVESLGY